MAIIAALFAIGSRFASKILTTTLGWASTLLFGRVPASRQVLLLGVAFGSVIWMVLVAGIVFPDIGAFLLVLLPKQEYIPESTIRLVMLAGALVVPGIVGVLTYRLADHSDGSARDLAAAIGRGYPLTVLLAVLLVFLAGLASWRKIRSLLRRWTDAHVPMVVFPGAYDDVARNLDRAITAAGLDVSPRPAPSTMSKPARWLARVGGRDAGGLVPDQMVQLHGPDLDILIYPMDVLISGRPELVARARAAIASRLTTAAAHLTVSAEAQAIEDRLTVLGRRADQGFEATAAAEFDAIDGDLSTILIPYEEWEVLYRQRLQVERDMRARSMANTLAAESRRVTAPLGDALGRIEDAIGGAAELALEAAADPKTMEPIEKDAGPAGKLAVSVISGFLQGLRSRRERSTPQAGPMPELGREEHEDGRT